MAFMAMLGSMILLQLYLQNVRGMSPLTTGLLVMPGGLTLGLGSLPPQLYSYGNSLLGTIQQVAGATGTALVVTIMTSRAASLVDRGVGSLSPRRWRG